MEKNIISTTELQAIPLIWILDEEENPGRQAEEDHAVWVPDKEEYPAAEDEDPDFEVKEKIYQEVLTDPLECLDENLEDPRRPANFSVQDADPFDYLQIIWDDEDTNNEPSWNQLLDIEENGYWNEEDEASWNQLLDIEENGYWNEEDEDDELLFGAGYVTPPVEVSSAADSESDELSTLDGTTSEEDDVAAHRGRVLQLILEWMPWIYSQKIEEEIIYLRNCNGEVIWNHSRLLVFKLLCYEELMDLREQILEGSIVIPISKEKK